MINWFKKKPDEFEIAEMVDEYLKRNYIEETIEEKVKFIIYDVKSTKKAKKDKDLKEFIKNDIKNLLRNCLEDFAKEK